MTALLAMLSQAKSASPLQTRKGLILIGLQNDFVTPGGKLNVVERGFLNNVSRLVSDFRGLGDVVFVQTQSELNRRATPTEPKEDTTIILHVNNEQSEDAKEVELSAPCKHQKGSPHKCGAAGTQTDTDNNSSVSSKGDIEADEELYLNQTSNRDPCCLSGTYGAEYADWAKSLQHPKDIYIVKKDYSAFIKTDLLVKLRSRLITELFICGCLTNLSVYATAMDAGRYGMKITLVEDCLGYRKRDRHDEAIKQLGDLMEVECVSSQKVISGLRSPDTAEYEPHKAKNIREAQKSRPIGDGPAKLATLAGASTLLEVDSDESDEESIVPIERLSHSLQDASKRRAASTIYKFSHASTTKASQTEGLFVKPHENLGGDRISKEHPNPRSISEQNRKPPESKLNRHSTMRGGKSSANSSLSSDMTEDHEAPACTAQQINSCHALLSADGSGPEPALGRVDDLDVNELAEQTQAKVYVTKCRSTPLFGEALEMESQGSKIFYKILPADLSTTAFDLLKREVSWQKMLHQTGAVPRLVCCQAKFDDDCVPVYRHPSDRTMPAEAWTPTVDRIRRTVERIVGHELNHVLIQLYRGGTDYISEHSDKTLDIVPGSFIVNVSLGAQRTMRLRTKRTSGSPSSNSRTTYRVAMPDSSMIVMSLETNARYLHGINADKRPAVEQSKDEKAFDGQRISLTFRNIGTFLNADASKIWGQGATGKTRDAAKRVVSGDALGSTRMVKAFGAENTASTIDWKIIYGEGFDVLHLK